MFKELYPLIQTRALTITVATMGNGNIRVNVVPQALDSDNKVNDKIGYSQKDKIAKIPDSAIAALTTPLSLVGMPEEIDNELSAALSQFAESHVQLQRTVEDAKQQIAAAVADIQEREKNRSKSSASAAKREGKSDKQATNDELPPLWARPTSEAPVSSPAASESEIPSAPAASTPAQQTLNSLLTEVKS